MKKFVERGRLVLTDVFVYDLDELRDLYCRLFGCPPQMFVLGRYRFPLREAEEHTLDQPARILSRGKFGALLIDLHDDEEWILPFERRGWCWDRIELLLPGSDQEEQAPLQRAEAGEQMVRG